MNRQGLLSIVGQEWFNILHQTLVSEVEFEVDGARAQYNRTDIKVYPEPSDVWNAFVKCPLSELKVVLLGQDVYPNGEGTGLCFEVKSGYKLTPSFKQLAEAYNETYPNSFNTDILDGKLERWAKQGVLLLNAYLTVEAGKPGSHKSYWEKFTKRLIKLLKEHDSNLIIVTLGKPSSELVDTSYSNVLRLEHPAYASRQGRKWNYQDFFNKVNQRLLSLNKEEIVW